MARLKGAYKQYGSSCAAKCRSSHLFAIIAETSDVPESTVISTVHASIFAIVLLFRWASLSR
jgi:hypothetical protein